jgi:hypothetical protein
MPLSVIIITRNESANIVACLESVAFADEVPKSLLPRVGKALVLKKTKPWPMPVTTGFSPSTLTSVYLPIWHVKFSVCYLNPNTRFTIFHV